MEKEKQSISIEGVTYNYIKNRLMGGSVYANENRSAYLRINAAAEITREINITKDLYRRGFPVPRVLGSGTLPNGDSYFIEESIGTKHFGDIFMEETKAAGQASDESFAAFTDLMKKYCEAQFNPTNFVPRDKETIAQMSARANVLRNNPPSDDMRDLFMEAYEKASERALTLPWSYIQSDLNAFNILPEGIIDFELAHFGAVGYDVLTSVYFGRMWPKDRVVYRFGNEQIARYVAEIDAVAKAHHLPVMSEYTEDFLVLKNIWSTGKDKDSEERPESNPEFWAWRIKVRDWCIRQYLKGEKIRNKSV